MFIPILLFAVGLVLLIKGGDWFVDGASSIAKRFHVPEILIGATVVSIGTTLPEVMVSVNSAISGHGEIAYGNAIGSIICNTALIAALTISVKPGKIDKISLRVPVIFFFIAAFFYAFVAYFIKEYTRVTGIILLLIFVIYMIIAIREAIGSEKVQLAIGREDIEETRIKSKSAFYDLFILILGAATIALGSNLLVENATVIAKGFGIPESVIALTFVALGTSLPELVTAITSLIKGHGALSLGNVIGANLFNLVLVSGASISLAPFSIPSEKLVKGINSSLVVDIPLMFTVMLILTVPAIIKGKLRRLQGIVLLILYGTFVIYQFM